MNSEETKKAAEVMLAWTEGKTIEVAKKGDDGWVSLVLEPRWNWQDSDYRIKPEPRYRPFENEEEVMEAMREHGDWVRTNFGLYRQVTAMYRSMDDDSNRKIKVSGCNWMPFADAFDSFHFIDGTPFGKLVEE